MLYLLSDIEPTSIYEMTFYFYLNNNIIEKQYKVSVSRPDSTCRHANMDDLSFIDSQSWPTCIYYK